MKPRSSCSIIGADWKKLGGGACDPSTAAPMFPPEPAAEPPSPDAASWGGGVGPAATLTGLFLSRCRADPQALAYAGLDEQGAIAWTRTRAELLERSTGLARALRGRAGPGERVLLAFEGGVDAVELFWACLLAGVVPVPAPPPDLRLGARGWDRLCRIAEDAGAVLGVRSPDPDPAPPAPGPLAWTSPRALHEAGAALPGEALRGGAVQPQDPAYLQYTSGSTEAPRGVVITHAQVLAHGAALAGVVGRRVAQPPRALSWLPWFHDYGIVLGLIQPLLQDGVSYLMPRRAFMRRPLRWLEAIARHRITVSGAPDFAYAACVRARSREPGWTADLRGWRLATCGAEPVRPHTLSSFEQAFGPQGFDPAAWAPAYGLAEAVLTVSLSPQSIPPRCLVLSAAALEHGQVREVEPGAPGSRTLVSCGPVLPGLTVKVVDPTGLSPLGEGRVGEIWVQGPSVAQRYWRKAAPEVFAARLQGDAVGQGWLRTGDLGFLADGELYLAGRLKDLIIVGGRNLHPEDLEAVAQSAHPALADGAALAFGVEAQAGEAVVLLVEVRGRPDAPAVAAIVEAVRATVAAEFEVEVAEVVVLRGGVLPRTSSGKPQRALARERYRRDRWQSQAWSARPQATAAAGAAVHPAVAAAWQAVLGAGRAVDPHTNFFDQGGDSLTATQLVSRLRAHTGVELSVRQLFESPTPAGLSRCLEQAAMTSPALAPPPLAAQEPVLSYAQERMWFMQQLAPASTAYHMPLALHLRGPLDIQALQSAVDEVVARHDILRTVFVLDGETVRPRVRTEAAPVVETVAPPPQARGPDDPAVHALLARLSQQPFDLARGPLMRMHLLPLGSDEHVLLIVQHHLIGDQWSFTVLARELAAAYARHHAGGAGMPPAPPALQYADYAIWHRRWYAGERHAPELAYWREQLADLEPLELPTDHPRPSPQGHRGARVRLPLAPALLHRLTVLGARHRASLAMVMMAAFKLLLYRHSGHADLAIGMPIANRHHLAAEDLLGTFVNTLVLRSRIDARQSFEALLEQVRHTALEAYAHQDMPFELLVRELGVVRDTSRSPLFQVLFNMVNAPLGQIDFPGLAWSRVDFDRQAAQFDLAVTIDPELDRSAVFEYALDLFEPATVQRLARHYEALLEAAVRAPGEPVAALPMLAPDELEALRSLASGPALPRPAGDVWSWLVPAFERYAAQPALECAGQVLSYAQLEQRSAALARALRRRGIGVGQRVGLCLSRNPDLLVAQLGVLRSGAAYVPLDPAYPPARLADMAEDAGLALLIAGETAPSWAAGLSTAGVRALQEEGAGPSGEPASCAGPGDPAYVIYTSGSTGRPKGVVVPHGAVVNFLASMAREPGLGPGERWLAVTTLSFDIAVLETLLPLGCGACIVLATDEQAASGPALRRLLEGGRITGMQATPSRWQMLLEAGWTGPAGLKALVGGEPLPHELAAQLLAHGAEVWNMYGPTETTVWSTCVRIVSARPEHLSIGRPIANTQAWVLDAHGQPCPWGVAGELHLGGAGLALGYWRRPELTAQRFIEWAADPGQPPQRLYRTGDRVRWRRDGRLEHLGRLDDQIKLRGHRIEPAEIEAVLAAHERVHRAVVMRREDRPGDARLVAYVHTDAPAAAHEDLRDALRERLRARLPDYMQPQHLVFIDHLPVLPNGKLDRRSLPAPAEPAASVQRVAPRNAAEQALWAVWAEVLGHRRFGVHEDFFDLGGHSLLAARLVHRIEARLGLPCSLAQVFEHPTVATLCEALDTGRRLHEASMVCLQPQGTAPALHCVCGVHIYQPLADALAPQVPVYGLFVPAELGFLDAHVDPRQGGITVERIAADYVRLLRERQSAGPYRLAGLSFGGLLALEMARQLRTLGEVVDCVLMFDTARPLRTLPGSLQWLRRQGRRLAQGRLPLAGRLGRGRGGAGPMHAAEVPQGPDPELIRARDRLYQRARRLYQPRPYDGLVMLVRAGDTEGLAPDLGWQGLLSRLVVREVPGDHLGILRAPQVARLAAHVQELLTMLPRRP